MGSWENMARPVEEAKATAAYVDEKVRHCEQILSGLVADDSNPENRTEAAGRKSTDSPRWGGCKKFARGGLFDSLR